jgi:flagellar biosynthetic protein FliR
MNPSLDELTTFLAAFARAAAFLQTAPYVGDRYLPQRYRVAVGALLALAVLPVHAKVPADRLMAVLPAELLVGITAGFVTKLVIAGAEAGGQLIGLELELGFAGLFDPVQQEETLPTRRLAATLAGLAFLAANGLGAAVRLLASARVDGRTPERALESVLHHSGQILETAIRIAAPTVVAAMVAHLTVAFANRAAPALNIFSVALALVLVAGGLALVTTAPLLVREILGIGRFAAEAAGGLR